MANLADNDRLGIWHDLMSACSRDRETVALSKADVRAAVDAADSWASSNAAAFNSALPVAARNNLTAGQKARLLAAVILRRYQTGA